ncbi:MAG: phage head-tail connector protein [Marinilabiliaceae bacterium]|nr:phage head-tail connector protein [Marinilabiliaceae bacterium]
MSYSLITPPSSLPVSLDVIKQHLRITHSQDDALLELYAEAARERWEAQTGFMLMSQTWQYVADDFPSREPVLLHKCPVAAVAAVSYTDASGNVQPIDPASIIIDNLSRPARIMPKSGVWPSTNKQLNAVSITFSAGKESQTDIHRSVRVALLMMIAHYYEHREEAADINLAVVPRAVETIMDLFSFREHR